jgi:hypothetical protein
LRYLRTYYWFLRGMALSKKQLGGITLGALVLAHFFITLGTDTPSLERFTDIGYYRELLFISLIAGAVLTIIVLQHNYLQRKRPLREGFWTRIALQTVTGVAVPGGCTFLLTWMYISQVLGLDITKTTFFIYEFPVSLVVNGVVNLFLLLDAIRIEHATPAKQAQPVSTLIVSKGQRQVPIPLAEVACIFKEGDFCFLVTTTNEQYSLSQTLDQLESMLNAQLFFRANRQTIVSRAACDHFLADRSGKLTLFVKQPEGREIAISQKRAAEFRVWLAL